MKEFMAVWMGNESELVICREKKEQILFVEGNIVRSPVRAES